LDNIFREMWVDRKESEFRAHISAYFLDALMAWYESKKDSVIKSVDSV